MGKFFPLLRPHVIFILETWLPLCYLLEDLIYYIEFLMGLFKTEDKTHSFENFLCGHPVLKKFLKKLNQLVSTFQGIISRTVFRMQRYFREWQQYNLCSPLKQIVKQTNINLKTIESAGFFSRIQFLELYRGRSDMPASSSRTIATSSTVVRSAALLQQLHNVSFSQIKIK